VDHTILNVTRADATALLAAAESDWNRPVPHCPAWDQAQLVRHTGGIFAWMAAVVTSTQQVSRRNLEPAPTATADLPDWYCRNLEQVLHVLSITDPETATWTFSSRGDLRVAWWVRRLAVEVAIHRWDAQHAAYPSTSPPPIDTDISVAGVEEFLIEFLPGLLTRSDTVGLIGTLHLHAIDSPLEWSIDLENSGSAIPEHRKSDTAIRGTRSDLLLWLTNRHPANLDVIGSPDFLTRWVELKL
jgi:uncharacterized protein (TIGR03083 family)